MSPQGKRVVGLALILAPSLFIILFGGLTLYKKAFTLHSHYDFFFDTFLLGILSSGATILVTYVTQIFIDKIALSCSMQQFIRYFSLVGYLLLAPVAITVEQIYYGNSGRCWANAGLIIIVISFILTGIGFLKAGNEKK